MLGIGLTPEETAKRLARLANLKSMYARQKRRIEHLVAENGALKGKVAELTATVDT